MMHSHAHISMNEGAVVYRIIKECACRNLWIFIILLSLQVKFVIDGKINNHVEISQEFLLHLLKEMGLEINQGTLFYRRNGWNVEPQLVPLEEF